MVSSDLLVTRNDGPSSAILPVQATSIMRAIPLPSHGSLKVPTPLESLGQSSRGWAGGGGGGGALAGCEGPDAAGSGDSALAVDAPELPCSSGQPLDASARAATNQSPLDPCDPCMAHLVRATTNAA